MLTSSELENIRTQFTAQSSVHLACPDHDAAKTAALAGLWTNGFTRRVRVNCTPGGKNCNCYVEAGVTKGNLYCDTSTATCARRTFSSPPGSRPA